MKNDLSGRLPGVFVLEYGRAVGIPTPQTNTMMEAEMQIWLGGTVLTAPLTIVAGLPALAHGSTRAVS